MIRLLIVDDHELVRVGLREILADYPAIEIVGEAGNGETALRLCRELWPDVVLLDICMPGLSGLETTVRLKLARASLAIIILSVHETAPYPERLMEAGASGYLTKGSDVMEVINAINAVHRGHQYLTRDVAEKVAFTSLRNRNRTPLERLSDRETEVMMMIIQGIRNKDIAEMLCLSPKTTSTLRYRLHEKLGVCNDVELTRYAIRHGIIKETAVS